MVKRITSSTNEKLDCNSEGNFETMKIDASLSMNEEMNDNNDIETVECDVPTTNEEFNIASHTTLQEQNIFNDVVLDHECNEDESNIEKSNSDNEVDNPEESANESECDDEYNDDFDEPIMPDKLLTVLNMIMFYESSIKVKEVFVMIQAIYLRFNLPKKVRQALLELVKLLAGPDFASLNISQYYMTQFYKVKDDKVYTFFVKIVTYLLNHH